MSFKIICCDGGGIRGLLTARLIEDLDNKFQIIKRANGFAGTSTGGLLALGMAHGVPISDMIDLYRHKGAEIFKIHSLNLQYACQARMHDSQTSKLIEDLDSQFQVTQKTGGFAGMSTGGILSQGMAKNISASKMIDLYRNECGQFFEPNGLLSQGTSRTKGPSAAKDKRLGRPGAIGSRYYSDGLKKILKAFFSDARLSGSERFIAINAAQLWNEKAQSWLPCTFSNLQENPFRDISMVDAALATSAAPTYFPPHHIQANGTDFGYFVDGGVFANNPVMTALTEALSQECVSNLSDIHMLSLGTGDTSDGITVADFDDNSPLSWGVDWWLWPLRWGERNTIPQASLLMLILETTGKTAEFQAKQILGDNYLRANFMLKNPFDIDDWQNIERLDAEVDNYLQTPEWESTCNRVKHLWT
ncbi:MAG: patatin-like phospholipase family protein [Enterobacteriaceae bacterium]|jgi:patatin-like phospholipase/acyl hydrolase|nr:patatin-like phospholipase family protein [Enterobacteriaceae bacterium]